METFYSHLFKIQWLFYARSISQFGLATFQVISIHMWLDSVCLDTSPVFSAPQQCRSFKRDELDF